MTESKIEIGKFEEQRPGYKHPYFVSIDMANENAPIEVAEGIGYHSMGANITAEEVISGQWEDHLKKCGCSKLIGIISSLISSGQKVTPQIIKEQWFGS